MLNRSSAVALVSFDLPQRGEGPRQPQLISALAAEANSFHQIAHGVG
jgi:hypothetical protein